MRLLILVLSMIAIACSDAGPIVPCTLLVKGTLIARLKQFDSTGKVIRVDSLYARPEVYADTFRVCGSDTTKISKTRFVFPDE